MWATNQRVQQVGFVNMARPSAQTQCYATLAVLTQVESKPAQKPTLLLEFNKISKNNESIHELKMSHCGPKSISTWSMG